jgi:hypothetical protein
MTEPLDLAALVNAIVRVASKPYVDFIEQLRADGRVSADDIAELNTEIHNQRLILVDLAREELARLRGQQQ